MTKISKLEAIQSRLGRLRRLASERGQATVEFALVLPALLLLILGMVDFGKAFNYWIDSTHLANEAVRAAVVNQLPDGSTANPNCATQTIECQIKQQANTNELKNGGSSITAPGLTVTFCLPSGTGNVGDPLRAQATSTYNWLGFLTGSFGAGLASKIIKPTATMRLETSYVAGTSSYTAASSCP
jgi:hypothetical protein